MDEQPLSPMSKPPVFNVTLHQAAICAVVTLHRGRNPRMFGAVWLAHNTDQSQLILLIDRTPEMRLLDIGKMYLALASLLGITVDIWTPEELPGWLKEDVLAECVPLSES